MTIPPPATPPSHGAPPPGPQPGRKYRPSAGWFVGGIVLVVAAGVVGVAMVVWLLAGFLRTDAVVTADGQPHRVSVGTDGDRMLWLEDEETSCSIVDLATGEPVEFRRVRARFDRSGSHGDLEGLFRFSPGSGDLEITCAGGPFADEPGDANVLVGPMPQIDDFVIGIVVAIVVPGLLGLAGVVMLIVTGVLWSLRPARPKGA